MKTTDTEYFHIQLLSNKKDSLYFIEEEVISSSVKDEVEEIPLELKAINKTETLNGYYIIDFTFKIGFHSEDYEINFTEAYLVLTYKDNVLDIPIGEFNYLFKEDNTNDISLINLEATYTEIKSIETVSGVLLTIRNNTRNTVVIKDIEVLSNTVTVMNDEVFVVEEEIDNFTEVKTILDKSFSHFDFQSSDITISIFSEQEVTLFGPLIFNGDIYYIHRFPIKITYLIGDEEKVFIIDDFPFMRENTFNTVYEEYIDVIDTD